MPIVLLLVAIMLFPFVRFFFKRLFLIRDLKGICNKKKFKFVRSGSFNGFFQNTKNNNLLIETGDCLYVIKFLGVLHKYNVINFIDETHYEITRVPLGIFRLFADKKQVEHERFSFIPIGNVDISKPLVPIMLINPVPVAVYDNSNPIGNGDNIGFPYFFTAEGFKRLLNKDE